MTTEVTASVSRLTIKIDGSQLSQQLYDALAVVEVENDVHLPDSATIRFHLQPLAAEVSSVLGQVEPYMALGKSVEISGPKPSGSTTEMAVIFKGEVTAASMEFGGPDMDGTVMAVIQAHDKAHRLHRGRKTKSYLNSKYSDVASSIARAYSLSATVDQTSGVHDYILQSSRTDWEFLWQLASRVGYEVYVKDDKLHFEKAQKSPGSAIPLEWGKDLVSFNVRSTSAFQVPKVTVRGWDWNGQQAIMGQATSGEGAPQIGESGSGTSQAQTAFGQSEVTIVDMPVKDQSEAQAVAQALADAIAGGHVHAEGITAWGRADILPRVLVDIGGVGSRFSGKYYVTATIHRFSGIEGYTTSFTVGGPRSNTMSELLDAGARTSPNTQRIQGVVPALVTNNADDQENLGRVKVKFPWLKEGENEVESWWARVAVPDAGPESGVMWTPDVGDEVLVAFEHGDITRPYVVGSLWNGQKKPPVQSSGNQDSGKVKQRVIKSRSGHQIVLDDTNGSEKITIVDKTGKNELVIDSSGGTLTVKIDKDISIEAGGKVDIKSTGDMTLNSSGKIDISATGDCNIQGANCNVKANAKLAMEGSAGAELKSNATLDVQANAIMNIKTSAIMNIQGSLVKIN